MPSPTHSLSSTALENSQPAPFPIGIILIICALIIILILLFTCTVRLLRRVNEIPLEPSKMPQLPVIPRISSDFIDIYVGCPSTTTPRNSLYSVFDKSAKDVESNTFVSIDKSTGIQDQKIYKSEMHSLPDDAELGQVSMLVSRDSIDSLPCPDIKRSFEKFYDRTQIIEYLYAVSTADAEQELARAYANLLSRRDGIWLLNRIFTRLSNDPQFLDLWTYLIGIPSYEVLQTEYANEWELLGDGDEVHIVKLFYCLGGEFLMGTQPGLKVGGRVLVSPK